MKPNYYNEIDKYAAEWLVELIAAGLIAPGVVDTRSIEDVHPSDLKDFTQCHFFAGIGVWSLALRRAGWADDRPIWTGSCPCQPFSAAGQGAGFADERHLWPAFSHLIRECKPAAVLGEQVASKDADPWIDLVHTDLEALGYAFGAVPFPSAGVGAPHIRDRLYWVAHADGGAGGKGRAHVRGWADRGDAQSRSRSGGSSVFDGVAHPSGTGSRSQRRDGIEPSGCASGGGAGRLAYADGWHASAERQQRGGEQRQQPEDGRVVRLADAILFQRPGGQPGVGDEYAASGRIEGTAAASGLCGNLRPGPTNGYWRDADWLGCTDGKWRPVEPGTFPLAHGAPARVGRLRAYGNAINAVAAQIFIEAVMEAA